LMKAKQFEIWLADLNPRIGTEAGKVRPVIVLQTDMLNKIHPSTIICPITTNIQPNSELLRVHLRKGMGKVKEECDIMMDQIRAIDNRRFIKKIGKVPVEIQTKLRNSLIILFDLI